jgi:hypothetical protein
VEAVYDGDKLALDGDGAGADDGGDHGARGDGVQRRAFHIQSRHTLRGAHTFVMLAYFFALLLMLDG